MKPALETAWILAAALAGVAGLLASTPLESGRRILERLFAAGPPWAQVERVYVDPATQEISHGENPAHGLELLETNWSATTQDRIVFLGNSQMFYVSLAPGEAAPKAPEKTYPDLVGEKLSPSARCYRLAAPGMSYTEALWYTAALAGSQRLRPTAIVLQLNYQSFWNGGIRDGMLGMLDDPAFAAAVRQMAGAREPYSADFTDALHRYTLRKAQEQPPGQPSSLYGPVLANRWESALRNRLESSFLWQERPRHRGAFFDLLYSSRIYLLHLNPTTARSIDGTRLRRSRAALEAIARLCRVAGIHLLLFNAPVNPQVSLYRSAGDLERYHSVLSELRSGYGVPLEDLEHAVPAPLWGTWMNGPDPLHLGRRAHQRVADSMARFLEAGLHQP